jgi:hypothetical protein
MAFFGLTEEQVEQLRRHLSTNWGIDYAVLKKADTKHKHKCASCGRFLSLDNAYLYIANHGYCHFKEECMKKGFKKLSKEHSFHKPPKPVEAEDADNWE